MNIKFDVDWCCLDSGGESSEIISRKKIGHKVNGTIKSINFRLD